MSRFKNLKRDDLLRLSALGENHARQVIAHHATTSEAERLESALGMALGVAATLAHLGATREQAKHAMRVMVNATFDAKGEKP